MKKYWQIFWLYRNLRLMKMLEYRTDFIFWSVVSVLWTAFNFFFFFVLTQLQDYIGGWSRTELFVLVSLFTMIDAFVWSFFYRNMFMYTRSIFDGSLDLVLTKPIDPQYLLSVQDNSYTNVFRFFIGLGTLLISVRQLGITVGIFQILLFIGLFIMSLLMIYSLWFILATCAFWIEKLENINEIFPAVRDIFRVPRTVYTGMFSFIFTILIPVLLITSVPSEVLIGKSEWQWILFQVLTTGLFFLLSRSYFHFSIKKYSSAGS